MEVGSAKWEVGSGRLGRWVGGMLGMIACAAAAIAGVPSYVQSGVFMLPSGNTAFDVSADGRVVGVDETGVVRRALAVNGSVYEAIGSFPSGQVPGFGAAFFKFSPDYSRFAVGDNGLAGKVYVAAAASLTGGTLAPAALNVPNFDGAWTSNSMLYVNGSASFGTPPSLYRVDVMGGAGGTVAPVVTGIGDGSGGVAARAGRVYTAIGFDGGGTLSGLVRSFDVPTLDGAAAAVPFSTGLLAAQANTGNTLDFDGLGNLIIAGFGGVRVIDLATQGFFDLPGLSGTGFYAAQWNQVTQEILVKDFGTATVVRFAVPAPGTGMVVGLGAFVAARRRRPMER